jgi:hypothetical protein
MASFDASQPVEPDGIQFVTMLWVYATLIGVSAWALQLGADPRTLSPMWLTIRMLGLFGVGISFALWMVRVWRRKSYESWNPVAHWTYLSIAIALAALGAASWAYAWAQNMGWPATAWFIGAPFIYGLLSRLWPGAQSSGPPA